MAIFTLCFLLLIDAMSFGLVIPVFAPLLTSANSHFFAATVSQETRGLAYSFLLAIPMLLMVFGCPFIGSLSDQYGRKKVLMISMLGVAFSLVLSIMGLLMSGLVVLFISRAVCGFMDGSEAVAQASIADLSAPEDKARNMSKVTLAMTLGFVIGPVTGGMLADHHLVSWFSYYLPFYVALGLIIVNIIMLHFFYQETMAPANQAQHNYWEILKNVFAAALDKRVRIFAFVYLCMQIAWASYFQAVSLRLVEHFHFSASQIGYFMTYIGFIFCITLLGVINIFLKFLADWLTVVIGMLSLMIGCLLIAIAPNSFTVLVISVVPCAMGVGMSYNVLLSFFSNAVAESEQGWIMGGITALIAVSWLSGAIITGLFAHLIALLFALMAVVALAAALGMIQFKRHHGQVATE